MNKVLMVVVVVVSGCGMIDGAPCQKQDATQCDGADVSYCERTSLGGLKWNTYACPSGCDAIAGKCSWSGVKNGTPCPPAYAPLGVCTNDGESTSCVKTADGGAVWKSYPCAKCQKDQPLAGDAGMSGQISCD